MKITELKIAPTRTYRPVSRDNPMRCTVKMESEDTAVETVLSADQIHQVLMLVQSIVADAARANVDQFCAMASQIDAPVIAAIEEHGNA